MASANKWALSGVIGAVLALAGQGMAGQAQAAPLVLQQPAISKDLIAFSYGGDLWTVSRTGGKAVRLTTGVGIEYSPVFSPDGTTLAFTGDYDGNVDVFTIPVAGGVPHRVTYHPSADVAVGWSKDGRSILFRSDRQSYSRYTQLFTVPAEGGAAKALPLPMAYAGSFSEDGGSIAYSPMPPAFGHNFTNYTAWGNYRGGRAGVIRITTLKGLDTVEVPHGESADFSPAYVGGKVYFLSGRNGPVGVFCYDPASRQVSEVFHNTGPDIRSLSTDGKTLVFDRLGEIWTLEPGGQAKRVEIDVAGDMPDVRPRLLNVADQVEHVAISATGLRVAVEAHGEILTLPVKRGNVRNLTNSPGVMERWPAWSPDGQSVAYFSDESGLYALHVASQTGGSVKKFPLAGEPAYYFDPKWAPDGKKIAFYDNRLNTYVLDTTSGKLTKLSDADGFGGFSDQANDLAWSPDSRWIVYTRSAANRLHGLWLYSLEQGSQTRLTDEMADARSPSFGRDGKHLYFLASNNAGAKLAGIDMTTDVYRPTYSVYALSLKASTPSPVAPEYGDEKAAKAGDEGADKAGDKAGDKGSDKPADSAKDAKGKDAKAKASEAPAKAKTTEIDLAGLSLDAIRGRVAALPLPARAYDGVEAGKGGSLYLAESDDGAAGEGQGATLSRWTLEDRKSDKLADHVVAFQLSADGEKMLVGQSAGPPGPGARKLNWTVAAANAPLKPGEGRVDLSGLEVRVDPRAEWTQMFHEVWRIERAFFYDPKFHGVDTVAEEKALEPYVANLQSRADLNYVFQEMLTGFSVGHLRGSGGAIPQARRVPGGLLGADYEIKGGRWCIAKIYTGGAWTPGVKGPLAQPGLDVHVGDCVLAVDGQSISGEQDIQSALEGTAGHAVTLKVGSVDGKSSRDVMVVPTGSEAALRNLDWIDGNRRKVAELSGGKLAYVYLPDTGEGGFTAFNRYFFAQTDKQGVVIDERFNAGGQIADYVTEILARKPQAYWAPRYGAIDHTPSGAIFGPKVMIANEFSGSGGDALPWLFKYNHLGTLVGKRTWGGLVGIGGIPVLMDGGQVTSPSVAFFNPKGEWEVENHGVAPDVVVDQDPKAVAAGHDPQLEAAVAIALQHLNETPTPPAKPSYPNYHPTPPK